MQVSPYKESLLEAVKALFNAENEVFTAMVNLGFSGEYSEISVLHEQGEVLELELSMFENTNDENLNKFSSLVKEMMRTRASLMNLNDISKREIEND